ncbi:MAG: DUF2089 domain-containing protein [Candidatus Promineifilaceae bacterium]|nr:DUF2089 domain-containing protein [Candidatus Promineifilaceae bacterium]
MNPVVGLCPICGHNLSVTRLHCRSCDSALEGHFTLGRLYHLNKEQLAFVETFIRCEGKITRVEQEMGLSYPAVRSRLNDVIRALGYEVGETQKETVSDEERRAILADVASGRLTTEEAVDLLSG